MENLINQLSLTNKISVVGGGKHEHLNSQLLPILNKLEYLFTEQGTVVYQKGHLIQKLDFISEVGEPALKSIINFLKSVPLNITPPILLPSFFKNKMTTDSVLL